MPSQHRQLIVVDLETTGLEPDCKVLEVAAINIDSGEELYFVPFVNGGDLFGANPIALQVNRYFERGVFKQMDQHGGITEGNWNKLANMLRDNTFAGSNPRFDSELVRDAICGSPWHHRLADIANYTAGHLGIEAWNLPGAEKCCELLSVTNSEPHSALGDARATAECFRVILRKQGHLL